MTCDLWPVTCDLQKKPAEAKRLISFQKSNGSWDKIFPNRLKKTDE